MPDVLESMGFPYEVDSPPVRLRYIDSFGKEQVTVCDNWREARDMGIGITATGGRVLVMELLGRED